MKTKNTFWMVVFLILFSSYGLFSQQGIINISYPNNPNISVIAGRIVNILWTSSNVNNVRLEYSIDNMNNWTTIGTFFNSGSYFWTSVYAQTNQAFIKITDAGDPTVSDTSAVPFTINVPVIDILSPLGGEVWQFGEIHNLNWIYSNLDEMMIEFSSDNGANWTTLTTVDPRYGSYQFTVPDIISTECRFRLSDVVPGGSSVTSKLFTITKTNITLSQPNGGESWKKGSTQLIKWDHFGVTNAKIELSTDGGTSYPIVIAATTPASAKQYSWTVSNNLSTNCKIRISDVSNSNIKSMSTSVFAITDLILTNPQVIDQVKSLNPLQVTWNAINIQKVNLKYSEDGGLNWLNIASNLTASTGSYTWNVPLGLPSGILVKVEDASNNTAFSVTSITIVNPDFFISNPVLNERLMISSVKTIEWTSQYITGNIKIEYSSNNGSTWVLVASNIPVANGTYNWTVPNFLSTQNLIKLTSLSNQNILKKSQLFITSNISITYPTATSKIVINSPYQITWNSTNLSGVKLEFSLDGGQNWNLYSGADNLLVSPANYDAVAPGTEYSPFRIKASDPTNPNIKSEVSLQIVTPSLTMTYPEGGEQFEQNKAINIKWASQYISSVKIEYSTDNGVNWNSIVTNLAASNGTYSWLTPQIVSNFVTLRITSEDDNTTTSSNINFFSLTDKSIKILSPNGGEKWFGGSSNNVSFETYKLSSVKIDYSTNNGVDWKSVTSNFPISSETFSGFYSWSVPKTPSAQCLMRISDINTGGIKTESAQTFSIAGIKVNYPQTGEKILVGSTYKISWTHLDVNNIRIQYSTNSGTTWNTIVNNYSAQNGFYNWVVPNLPSLTTRIRLMDVDNSGLYDETGDFTLNGLLLTSPKSSEILYAGTTHNILWRKANVNKVKLEYSINNGTSWITIISEIDAALGAYNWNVPKSTSTNCKIKVTSLEDATIFDSNTLPFTISGSGLKITYPIGNEKIQVNTIKNITWTSINVLQVKIEYSIDNGTTWQYVLDNNGDSAKVINSSLGTFSWKTPLTPSTECLIKITDINNTNIYTESPNVFRIYDGFYPPPTSWKFVSKTGSQSTVIIPSSIKPKVEDRDIMTGDVIGAFFTRNGEYICAGYSIWSGSDNMAITIWGDNPRTTNIKDGFAESEVYTFKVWDGQEGQEYFAAAEYATGNTDYFTNDNLSLVTSFNTFGKLAIPLYGGIWSYISANVIPTTTNLDNLLKGIVPYMDYMKNDKGEVFIPEEKNYVNTIGTWNVQNGYQIYMLKDTTLYVTGRKVNPVDYPIDLEGMKWYLIPYLLQKPFAPDTALYSVKSKLLLMKDQNGKVYYPDYGISQIDSMRGGEAYKIIIKSSEVLTYPGKQRTTYLDSANVFSMDLIGYYRRNIKQIFTGETDETWSNSSWQGYTGYAAKDYTYFKVGFSSVRCSTNSISGGISLSKSLDLTRFNDGSSSTTADYISFQMYLDQNSFDNLTDNGLILNFYNESKPSSTNFFRMVIRKSTLKTGWNFLKYKKSDFISSGTPIWSSVTGLDLFKNDNRDYQVYFYLDNMQLIKRDPVSNNISNQFLNSASGALSRDFTVNSGEWYIGPEFSTDTIAREISGVNTGFGTITGSIVTTKSLNNFQIEASIKLNKAKMDRIGWQVDNSNKLYITHDGANFILGVDNNGVQDLNTKSAQTLAISDGLEITMVKLGKLTKVTIIKNGNTNSPIILSKFTPQFENISGFAYYGGREDIQNTIYSFNYYPVLYSTSVSTKEITYPVPAVYSGELQPVKYIRYDNQTGNNQTIIIESTDLAEGDEVGVWSSDDVLCGSAVFQNGKALITVWGDNNATSRIEGSRDNEPLKFTMWSKSQNKEFKMDLISNKNVISGKSLTLPLRYNQDGINQINAFRGKVLDVIENSDEYSINLSPNPTTEYLNIIFENSGLSIISIFDNNGNLVERMNENTSGKILLKIDTKKYSNGMYNLTINNNGKINYKKFVVIK
jgi:hypothetical protein